ncbi:MAG TPA: hypothetical protein VD905_00225 [Flavobacteriales bacterium]|nr:hypothetical protein [Flavobacteriales bacterium]
MRRAFIGLSSPLGYNYANNFEDNNGKPNPLLDSPMGLFLFYDEIWFINRRTCPVNCEKLPYVKFLDEEYNLNNLILDQFSWENQKIEKQIHPNLQKFAGDRWIKSIEINVGKERWGIDNHSRHFKLGKIGVIPNPTIGNLMIDDYIANHYHLELITNSYTSVLASSTNVKSEDGLKNSLTQLLICENIPNFQLESGPYHSFIDDLRSEPLLINFRKKIDEITKNKKPEEADNLKKELNKAMEIYQNELILKIMDKNQLFKSVGKFIIGKAPVVGNVYEGLNGGMEVYKNLKTKEGAGWIGFLAKSRLLQDKEQPEK